MVNLCPVCGYLMAYPPSDHHICPSCGTEFGYDDAGRSHTELRRIWLLTGPKWWSPVDPQPPDWNPIFQLSNLISWSSSAWTGLATAALHFGPSLSTGLSHALSAEPQRSKNLDPMIPGGQLTGTHTSMLQVETAVARQSQFGGV